MRFLFLPTILGLLLFFAGCAETEVTTQEDDSFDLYGTELYAEPYSEGPSALPTVEGPPAPPPLETTEAAVE